MNSGWAPNCSKCSAIARSIGAGPALMGVLVASFPLGIVGASVLAADWIKRGRATKVLTLSLTMVAVGSLGFVLGDGLIVYFVSRLIMGVGAGGVWMGITFNILERCPGEEYLCMSRVFAAYAVGGLPEYVGEPGAGRLVETGPENLAAACLDLHDDPAGFETWLRRTFRHEAAPDAVVP